MTDLLRTAMLEAAQLTRAGRLTEATLTIQRALGGIANPGAARPDMAPEDAHGVEASMARHRVIDVPTAQEDRPPDSGTHVHQTDVGDTGSDSPDAAFIAGVFSNPAGTRHYKLYHPRGTHRGHQAAAPALVVMLHGCTQDPDDFAAGTRMNQLAGAMGAYVLYPAQTLTANGSGCWNWFNPEDQQRGRGEPSIIADLTREVTRSHGIDPGRVYVAGLSAGGAMAAILASTYPDLYAAAGIHSGLAYGAAEDLGSALSAMRQGAPHDSLLPLPGPGDRIPTIIFHGDHDMTVHPINALQLIAQTSGVHAGLEERSTTRGVRIEHGRVPGGHAYTRRIHQDPRGRPHAELWLVHGAGHGWSGGSLAGSQTEPLGPDASREMLRFFAAHGR